MLINIFLNSEIYCFVPQMLGNIEFFTCNNLRYDELTCKVEYVLIYLVLTW